MWTGHNLPEAFGLFFTGRAGTCLLHTARLEADKTTQVGSGPAAGGQSGTGELAID